MINCSSKKLQVMDGVDKLRLSKVEVLHLPGLKAYVPGSSGAVGLYPLSMRPVLHSTEV